MMSLPGIGAMSDPSKFGMPGWKVERRYDDKVLIGNWYEQRQTFARTPQRHNSTYRRDFKFYPEERPDTEVRRNAFIANKGLSKDMIFGHHGKAYTDNMITMYDEYINKRERPADQALPETRSWNSKTMTWSPEKIDHPLQGEPTNWGLKAEVEERRRKKEKDLNVDHFTSTYQIGYTEKPIDTQLSRYAVPRDKSTCLLPINRTNRNLNLRNVPLVLPQMPQTLQVPKPYVL